MSEIRADSFVTVVRRLLIAPLRFVYGIYAIVAFLVNLVTGSIFILGRPSNYVHARSLWAKLFFVIIAGTTALLFRFTLRDKAAALAPGDDTSFPMKLAGAVSLASWFMVMYFGRMVPYFGRI